ncbi:MAG: hypothetical protein NC427_06120 [Ruminococcus flavefaciens]|nr:hypothetical protein [Ruminococcus flavefaciens]
MRSLEDIIEALKVYVLFREMNYNVVEFLELLKRLKEEIVATESHILMLYYIAEKKEWNCMNMN